MTTIDRRPIDWTSYTGRPNPDPVYGLGLITGYQRCGVYDTLKPQYPVDGFAPDTSVAVLEHEDGQVGTVVHRTDPRYFPREAPGELGQLSVVAKAVKLGISVKFDARAALVPLLWYRPVMLRPGQPLEKYKAAVKVQMNAMGGAVDGLVIDAHPHYAEVFDVWRRLLDEQIGVLSGFGKPLVAVICEQWHPADGPMAWKYLSEREAVQRYSYARQHKGLATVARMGGYDGEGGFRRYAYGSNPAESAINRALGV